jgi:hypothetical protein
VVLMWLGADEEELCCASKVRIGCDVWLRSASDGEDERCLHILHWGWCSQGRMVHVMRRVVLGSEGAGEVIEEDIDYSALGATLLCRCKSEADIKEGFMYVTEVAFLITCLFLSRD